MSLSPGISPKQLIPGMGVNDPPYKRQILPELNSFYQGICQSYPGGVVVVYAGAPIATFIYFFSFCLFGDFDFSEYFLYHCRFLDVWRVRRRTFFPSGWCFSSL